MALTEQQLLAALAVVKDPHTDKDFVVSRAIRNIRINADSVAFDVAIGYPARSLFPTLHEQFTAAAQTLPGIQQVTVNMGYHITSHAVQRGMQPLAGVKNIFAVASGKGGVGKSTTAVNLALALAAEGAQVGLLDADIYGPSVPMMTGTSGEVESRDGKLMEAKIAHFGAISLQVNSIGFLVKPEQAMIWRGPMASQALEQLLRQTRWDGLDYLVVDMPPGTGDIQLTMAQKVPLTGAVIVTTPQDIALLDARKGISMFEKVQVPILGIVENMAMHQCSQCGHVEHIFGADGGRKLAQECATEWLGALPLALAIRQQADSGCPTVAADPQGEAARTYLHIARTVAAKIALQGKDFSAKFPTIVVSRDT